MDALALLKKDHDAIKKLLKELEDTTERAVKTREEGFGRLTFSLTVHEQIEETILYPALKQHAQTKDLVLEAYEEHDVVDKVLGNLQATPFDEESWHAKLKVMSENLHHHIEEEEEGRMFEQARAVFDREVLEQLGGQMQQVKSQARAV